MGNDDMGECTKGYTQEELIPVVAMLVKKYTSNESSSVTYERARELMNAVIYCINFDNEGNGVVGANKPDAMQSYKNGYEKVVVKVCEVQEKYNSLMTIFDAYENRNYKDTVQKAIKGFFLYYDPLIAPQENIITMDYKLICPINELRGIKAISAYVDGIYLEQIFLGNMPREHILQVLSTFHSDYKNQFFNICSILLRNILGNMIIGKSPDMISNDNNYEELKSKVYGRKKEDIKEELFKLLGIMIKSKYVGDERLFEYLSKDLEDFAVELINGAENGCLRRVVVL